MKVVNIMLRSQAVVLALIAPFAHGASLQTISEIHIGYNAGNHRIPVWMHGALTVVSSNETASPVLHLFDRQGIEMPPIVFSMPGAVRIHIEGVATGPEKLVAFIGSAYDQDGRGGGFVAHCLQDGSQIKIIHTFPYLPYNVALGSDRSIWTAGLEMVNGSLTHAAVNGDGAVIRRFEDNGVISKSFLPRTSSALTAAGLTQAEFAVNGKKLVRNLYR